MDVEVNDWIRGEGGTAVIDFEAHKEVVVDASPEVVFGYVSDLANHDRFSGSGEVLKIRKLTKGETHVGSMIEADEHIELGDQVLDFAAKSVVVGYEPNHAISWMPVPPMPIRRIQWWFTVEPEGTGTKVIHECEVDLGDEVREMFGGTKGYRASRGKDVARGMDQTVANLKELCEAATNVKA